MTVLGRARPSCACSRRASYYFWIIVGQGLTVFVLGVSWGCLDIFVWPIFFFLSPDVSQRGL